MVGICREQAAALIRGGVDLLLIETSQDILEVKAVIQGIQLAYEETGEVLPIQVQVTLDTTGRMLLGTDIETSQTILEGLPIDVIGLNCSTGPEHMREPISFLGEHSHLPVSAIPNAGLPLNVDGEAVYPLKPEPYAAAMVEFIEKHNVSIVGGCCGTTPEHLKLLVEAVHGHAHPPRPDADPARLSSSIQALSMRQEPPPLLIGERLNATGSRKFKRLLMEEDWDGILEMGREQIGKGAHALDVSVAITERPDEDFLMSNVVKKLAMGVEAPLVIDTTDPDVMEIALKLAPGRTLLNSTHLEAGRSKLDQVMTIASEHNAAVLILTIDEKGMAKSAARKLDIAKRIHDIAVDEFGFKPEDLVFDVLTFPLSTGDKEFDNSAVETIEAIRQIKTELPGVFTSLGVSNVSFGLRPAARPVLNSLMLHHCVKAGLDMAIINAAHITPYPEIPAEERELMEDLIFNRRADGLQRVIEFYEDIERPLPGEEDDDPTEGMAAEERLHWRILHRHKDGVDTDIDELIERNELPTVHENAVHVLNNVMLPAMKEVGDKFGSGELILPFVLQSAEVMKTAVTHLDQYLEKVEGVSKGKLVLATVYGDVHDIGKNLVKTIIANNGFEVFDLGKQVPAETIIEKAIEVGADAIGLSALLVSTSKQMPLIVNELHRRGLHIPVMIGGAAINRRFGYRILYSEDDGQAYAPGVFYCADAFEGLETMEQLVDEDKSAALLEKVTQRAARELERAAQPKKKRTTKKKVGLPPAKFLPKPDEWGVRVVKDMPLELVFEHLFKNELFRLSWGAKNARGEEWNQLEAEFEARLDKMKRAALKEKWLLPQGVYGYWPVQSQGDDLILYDPQSLNGGQKRVELARFSFPRQPSGEQLALSDYFVSVDSDQIDTVALQIVTVGAAASTRVETLQTADDYSEAYFTHGLAVQTAEAAAEYLHRHIRAELGLEENQGKRYSWGYPAIPDLDDHAKVFELLPAEQELGIILTSAYQFVPEQSTAAIIVHHPQASYYSVGESRVEQLMKA